MWWHGFAFSRIVRRGVKANCQGEVAILFSGGLDSTAVAAVAKKYANANPFW